MNEIQHSRLFQAGQVALGPTSARELQELTGRVDEPVSGIRSQAR